MGGFIKMLGPLKNTARLLPLLLLPLSTFACADASSPTESGPVAPEADKDDSRANAERLIAEADIVQLRDGRLYAMSKSGTVAVVDVSAPGRLTLLGKARLPGQPFEMYLRGNQLVTMSNNAFQSNGSRVPITDDESRYPSYYAGASSAVIVLDISNPTGMQISAMHVVPGKIDDSRVIGDILYLVSTENGSCYRCAPGNSTHVSSYGLTDALGLPKIDDLVFSPAADAYGSWERSVSVGKDRLYLGGVEGGRYGYSAGEIDVVDVSDPQGHLVRGAHLRVTGPIYTRWQIDERDNVLRVVSQPGAYGQNNAYKMPAFDTFTIESSQKITPLGHMEMDVPSREGLRGVRFDNDRAFVITYRRTDPLYAVDLTDPKNPRQRGELHIPGFVFHMEPHGDRLLGLGVDTDNEDGNLNVSLFDVKDLDNPRMIERVAFGGQGLTGNDATARVQLAEDHDRIQKAFKVLDDGLIVVPFSGTAPRGYGDTCESTTSGVQLIEWQNDRLVKRAHLPLQGNPRRALQNQSELIAVSDSNVRTFSLANKDVAQPTADVVIGKCVSRYGYDDRGGFLCSVHLPGSGMGGTATLSGLLGLLGFVVVRRRRCSR